MGRSFTGFLVFLFFTLAVQGQDILSGHVIDVLSGHGIGGAEIRFKGSDNVVYANSLGEFRISREDDTLSDGEIIIRGHTIYWNLPASAILRIYTIAGQETHCFRLNVGEGEMSISNIYDGIYLLRTDLANGKSYYAKLLYQRNSFEGTAVMQSRHSGFLQKYASAEDTLVISKSGYYTQEYPVNSAYSEYELMLTSYPASTDYLHKLIRAESFKLLEGPPLNPVFSGIRSVKILYSIIDDKIYFTNSTKYFIHYEFARDVLNYSKGHYNFNLEQYHNNPNRIYILASLNYFAASGIYTLDFFSGDDLECSQIEKVYNKVVQTTYVGNNLKFYSNNLKWTLCNDIPAITSNELFAGQNYQPLNPEEAYGYLRKFTLPDLQTQYAGRHDIVLLNGIPNDISVVAGIITTEFQTPLSHINVLSHNRGAPNMALRDGWTNPVIESLNHKLVYLKVTLDTFILREATLSEAESFWALKDPTEVTILPHDTITQGLVNLSLATIASDVVIGGKAANFSELMKINVSGYGPLPLPEGPFAIPFYYYWQHMRNNSLDVFVRNMLEEERFYTDFQYRRSQLLKLQDSIKASPVDPVLLGLIIAKINESGGYTRIRFRSSTNSEDMKGFNGAGLYDSYTGIPGDPGKSIEGSIKKVWASLWNLPAFEEREYFKIDQHSIAMAILVHRSFPDEAANGVLITKNLYNPYNPGFTINAQFGEISITNPEGGYIPDQIIRYTFDDITEYINHSNVPGMQGSPVLTDNEIKELEDYCMAIQSHFCALYQECLPLDIEFKVDLVNGLRKVFIKQARVY